MTFLLADHILIIAERNSDWWSTQKHTIRYFRKITKHTSSVYAYGLWNENRNNQQNEWRAKQNASTVRNNVIIEIENEMLYRHKSSTNITENQKHTSISKNSKNEDDNDDWCESGGWQRHQKIYTIIFFFCDCCFVWSAQSNEEMELKRNEIDFDDFSTIPPIECNSSEWETNCISFDSNACESGFILTNKGKRHKWISHIRLNGRRNILLSTWKLEWHRFQYDGKNAIHF